jgi:hypothetical protein
MSVNKIEKFDKKKIIGLLPLLKLNFINMKSVRYKE